MSAVSLARRLALRRADGTLAALPRFTLADDPLRVRAHLLAFYELRDALERERAALAGVPGSLSVRLRLGVIAEEIEVAIRAAKDCLRRLARRGGRGVAVSGCRGEAPAAAVGPVATSPAVGGALASRPVERGEAGSGVLGGQRFGSAGTGATGLTDPLFSGPAGQDLPGPVVVYQATAAQEAASDEIA